MHVEVRWRHSTSATASHANSNLPEFFRQQDSQHRTHTLSNHRMTLQHTFAAPECPLHRYVNCVRRRSSASVCSAAGRHHGACAVAEHSGLAAMRLADASTGFLRATDPPPRLRDQPMVTLQPQLQEGMNQDDRQDGAWWGFGGREVARGGELGNGFQGTNPAGEDCVRVISHVRCRICARLFEKVLRWLLKIVIKIPSSLSLLPRPVLKRRPRFLLRRSTQAPHVILSTRLAHSREAALLLHHPSLHLRILGVPTRTNTLASRLQRSSILIIPLQIPQFQPHRCPRSRQKTPPTAMEPLEPFFVVQILPEDVGLSTPWAYLR